MKYLTIIVGAVVLVALTPFDDIVIDTALGAAWGFLVSLLWPRPERAREEYWQ